MEGVIMFDYRRVVRTFGSSSYANHMGSSKKMRDGPQVMAMMGKNMIVPFANIY